MRPPQGSFTAHFRLSGMRAVKIASAVVASFQANRVRFLSDDRGFKSEPTYSATAQLVDSRTRNKRAATGSRNTRSTLTMTERDKVRDAPSLGKQAAIGTRGSSAFAPQL
ncbi:hypothetical protein CEXT_499811 [Caerostris extrusa]|uniref:Uncharacterized protein n=1 Tax=Caerostris extrusa TaxID=172846 RepID=A0AAV4MV48_CAEEX|nr:hypothetical protein CEXT_499811 [Caerostris extrusa]